MTDSATMAGAIRRDALQMVHDARASHIGSALSIADILAVLYADVLRLDPVAPAAAGRDRFVLSKGHACVAVYAALANAGVIPRDSLKTYGQEHSLLMNHISHKVPGVEFSTGSLGHGLPFGVGKALSARKRGQPWRTFVLVSDGELGEGSNWEALLFAAHHRLDKLVTIVDYNNLQSLTTVADPLGVEPLADKFAAFGCTPRQVDGHDHAALLDALKTTPWNAGRPAVLIAQTTKGKGVSFMENRVEWHYKSPDCEQLARALAEVGGQPGA